MQVELDAIDLCFKLAHKRLIEEHELYDDDSILYEDPTAAITTYKEKYQEEFNRYYDGYFEVFSNELELKYK